MTRWSLFAPVIVRERLGPLASLRRSNELARGNFELVFLTAAFAVVLEEAVADAGALGGLALTGSEIWGEWMGGTAALVVILPVASFATALVYGRLRLPHDLQYRPPRTWWSSPSQGQGGRVPNSPPNRTLVPRAASGTRGRDD